MSLCLPTITLSNEASVVVNFALESPLATCLYARHPNTHFPSVPERYGFSLNKKTKKHAENKFLALLAMGSAGNCAL